MQIQANSNLMTQTEKKHPIWQQNFDATDRAAQLDEDLFAAKSVCNVLITIVCVGAVVGALSVLVATAM